MTLRHLKVFIAVAETGKMSDAAKQLYIAQPSVSQTISEIESYYGGKLFERLNRKLYITPMGEQLLDYARHIVVLFEEMEQQVRTSANTTNIKIGATITVGTCIICDILDDMEKDNVNIKSQVIVANTHEIEEKLLRGEVDAALIEGVVKSASLISRPVIKDNLILVASPAHPLAGKEWVDIEELAGIPFILRESGSGTREQFEQKLREKNIPLVEGWVCNNSEAIKGAVCRNHGVTVISKRLVEKELLQGTLVSIKIKEISLVRNFSLVYHKNKYLNNATECFIKACEIYDSTH